MSMETAELLERYRVSFKDALSDVYGVLCELSVRVKENPTVTYRIKRFESIIDKLERYPRMQLDRMWDIAGCRCIFTSNKQAYRMVKLIRERLDVVKEYDYVVSPQDSGYRSIHVFVRHEATNRTIEVQVRNHENHSWATLVEISDLLFGQSVKTGRSSSDLARFHRLLSGRAEMRDQSIRRKAEIIRIAKRYRYVERLSELFARNYFVVREQWIDIGANSSDSYFLLETTKNLSPRISAFESFLAAEDAYFSDFRTKKDSNIVLTYLKKATFKRISMAYSNYFLTYHQFIDDCFAMLEDLIVDSIRRSRVFRFRRFLKYYMMIDYLAIGNLNREMDRYAHLGIDPKMRAAKEWGGDISVDVSERTSKRERFVTKLVKNPPRGFVTGSLMVSILKNTVRKRVQRDDHSQSA